MTCCLYRFIAIVNRFTYEKLETVIEELSKFKPDLCLGHFFFLNKNQETSLFKPCVCNISCQPTVGKLVYFVRHFGAVPIIIWCCQFKKTTTVEAVACSLFCDCCNTAITQKISPEVDSLYGIYSVKHVTVSVSYYYFGMNHQNRSFLELSIFSFFSCS